MSAQATPVSQTTAEEFQTGEVLTIVGGHSIHDTFSAFVPPLLPLIIEKLSLSLTLAGSLVALVQIPALLNPFIGYLADKISLRYFVILAPAVTATLAGLLGLAPNTTILAILLLAIGVSVACFHAPAPAMVGRISGARVGKGMSYFMAAGELGRAVGPLLVAATVSLWTLDGYYRVMVIGWAASLILYWRLRNIPARPDKKPNVRAMIPAARRLYLPLFTIAFPKAFLLVALSIYLPTFMVQQGSDFKTASITLAVFELAGVAGALAGGTFSDKLGRKQVLFWGLLSSSLLMFAFLYIETVWLLVLVLLALGFTALSSTPVMLALVQEQMPDNRAMANGVYLTMAFLIRPIAIFTLGFIGDRFGLNSAYLFSAVISLAAIPGIFLLPQSAKVSAGGIL